MDTPLPNARSQSLNALSGNRSILEKPLMALALIYFGWFVISLVSASSNTLEREARNDMLKFMENKFKVHIYQYRFL